MCTFSQCVTTCLLSHHAGYDVSVSNTTAEATEQEVTPPCIRGSALPLHMVVVTKSDAPRTAQCRELQVSQ